jgi:hypothetical protein
MEKEVVIKQTLDPRTVQKAGSSMLLPKKGPIILYIVIVGIFSLTSLIGGVDTPADSTNNESAPVENINPDFGYDIFVSLIPILIVIAILTLLYFIRIKSVRKQIEKKARYFTNVIYTINNSFFKNQGEGFENTYYWNEVYKIKETSRFYLIFTEKFQAHVIDKSQLDPWQAEDLKDIVVALKPKVKVSLK